jgi:alkylation response protein AidB-like acyl-CoA dehydrogenase
MDLRYGPEYEAFRRDLRAFLEANRDKAPAARGGEVTSLKDPKIQSWQKLLIERGYAARTIPKQYGGGGFAPDPLIATILAEEFGRARVSSGV